MADGQITLASVLAEVGEPFGESIKVTLSNNLARLLSKQLYSSPLKAVEELIVNAYDADAKECKVFVPPPSDTQRRYVLVYDDGTGMDYEGLQQLWQIGSSGKPDEKELTKRFNRKQIGRFGIGKLATYTIANRLTYVTKPENSDGEILSVSVDFRGFISEEHPIPLVVHRVDNWAELIEHPNFSSAASAAEVDLGNLTSRPSWTIAFLEILKEEANEISIGRLERVLRTAMPLRAGFNLYLNKKHIESSKIEYEHIVEFGLEDLPTGRIDNLDKATGEEWQLSEDKLATEKFPSGISGQVFMTRQTLTGKSDDLSRSHGFFVYVHGRLINEEDPLFGLRPLSYKYFHRLHASIEADDLHTVITAPREGIEESAKKEHFEKLLGAVFNEARDRYEAIEQDEEDKNKRQKEGSRNFVTPPLVEYPLADALTLRGKEQKEAEATGGWFYLKLDPETDSKELIRKLYEERVEAKQRDHLYKYIYTDAGSQSRLVKFDPGSSTFEINQAHEFVNHHMDEGRSQGLLEDIVTAEALLEVYLREAGITAEKVGEVLERRDTLLKSLAKDRPYSLTALATALRDAASDEYDLEIALVAAARSLGFVATHISGSDEPDGVARYIQYPEGERKIILEAKSSKNVPSLGSIDFAGLHEHMTDDEYKADGCLLVAPAYPGASKEDYADAAKRAKQQRISCWTVEQLAQFVECAEEKKLTASDVLDIVLSCFSPNEVAEATSELFEERKFNSAGVYERIISVLRNLEQRMPHQTYRTVDNIHTALALEGFDGIDKLVVKEALKDLARTSRGSLMLRDDRLVIYTSLDEVERRVASLTKSPGQPRRPSNFRS